jgi:hypothetical protein
MAVAAPAAHHARRYRGTLGARLDEPWTGWEGGMRTACGWTWAALCVLGAVGATASAGEPETLTVDWPVASFELEAPVAAAVWLNVGAAGAERALQVGAEPTYVVARPSVVGGEQPPDLGAEQVRARLPAPLRGVRISAVGPDTLAILPKPAERGALRDALPRLLEGPRLELRFVVQPTSRRTAPLAHDQPAPRVTWPGSEAEFDAFVAKEAARWEQAEAEMRPYEPSRPGLTLARGAKIGSEEMPEWVVLEVPQGADDFTARDIASASVIRDLRGAPAVGFEVQAERRAAFKSFTERSVGLPLAIVVDGRVLTAPVVGSPLDQRVEITLGRAEWKDMQAQAERLSAILGEARAGRLDLVAVLEPAGPARRRLRVPLGAHATLPVSMWVGNQAPRSHLVKRTDGGLLTMGDTALALLAARATGELRAPWADTPWRQVTRKDMGAVLLAMAQAAKGDALARADALELAGLLDGEDPPVIAALEAAAKDPSPYVAAVAADAARRRRPPREPAPR